MIKLGVTPRFFYAEAMKSLMGPKAVSSLENDIARFLSRKGVMPILIPDIPQPFLDDFLNDLDGFVLQGGSDMAPSHYGEEAIDPQKWPGDPYRDKFELHIVDYAFTQGKPILGICRGLQLINVFFGGTLYQDIATQHPKSISHRNPSFDSFSHEIKISPIGVLRTLYPEEKEVNVNSIHHQGIKSLGKGLTVEAISPRDGIIEAVSAENGRILAVQWHPEFSHTLGSRVLDPNPLLDFLITQCQQSKQRTS